MMWYQETLKVHDVSITVSWKIPRKSHSFSPTPLKQPPLFCCWAHFSPVKGLRPSSICTLQPVITSNPCSTPYHFPEKTATADPFVMETVNPSQSWCNHLSLCCCFPAVSPLFFIRPASCVWDFTGKMNYDSSCILHLPTPHHEFQSSCQCLSRLWVNSCTNHLAILASSKSVLASGLQPPTSDLYYVCAAFPSPGLSSLVPAHEKPHANKQPDWSRVSWRKRMSSETTDLEEQDGHSAPQLYNQGQRVLLDPHCRPWLRRVVFSLHALEERQRSEPGEFLTWGRATPNCAGSSLGSQPSWAPAALNSGEALGRLITPFMPHSQSANWELTT